ncbi:PT repeat-containing protein [Actinocorallia herbida]|uniref:PT repeat-containing protein n=1 Tax=Actinocorallia herbida TaxID=58109 RepID=A0A3N1D5L3_9ACTN|nr:PT domain-containing protein [Actinocorallia herbida]ROO88833.1 PT repeat-containing protein [Actinocorallia herbida]
MKKIVRIAGGLALAGVLACTAACGGDEATDGGTQNGGDFTAFQECLEKNGVSMPQGGGMGGGGQRPSGAPTGRPSDRPTDMPSGQPTGRPSMSAEQQAAFQECSSLMPQGGGGGGFPGGGQGGEGGQGGGDGGQGGGDQNGS